MIPIHSLSSLRASAAKIYLKFDDDVIEMYNVMLLGNQYGFTFRF